MADPAQPPSLPAWLVRRYLRRHGWNTLRLKNAELFSKEDIELVLSTATDEAAVSRSISDIIRALAQFEARPEDAVAGDIRSSGYDIIRSRLPDSLLSGDGVPMHRATMFVTSAKELLAASATSEIDPRRAYPRNRKEAIAYSDRVIFGHTFRGSFGFVIESPIELSAAQAVLFADAIPIPFERRVVERLVRGIRSIDTAIRNADVDAAVAEHETGFNANMCEQFADLVEKVSPEGLSIDVAFSPELAPRTGIAPRSEFVVTHRHAEFAAEMAQRLRKLTIDPHQTIVGRVISLRSDDNPADVVDSQSSREISIEWDSKAIGSQIRVRVVVTPTDYLAAVEAHKNGRAVQISGELERPGRRWRLINASKLGVL